MEKDMGINDINSLEKTAGCLQWEALEKLAQNWDLSPEEITELLRNIDTWEEKRIYTDSFINIAKTAWKTEEEMQAFLTMTATTFITKKNVEKIIRWRTSWMPHHPSSLWVSHELHEYIEAENDYNKISKTLRKYHLERYFEWDEETFEGLVISFYKLLKNPSRYYDIIKSMYDLAVELGSHIPKELKATIDNENIKNLYIISKIKYFPKRWNKISWEVLWNQILKEANTMWVREDIIAEIKKIIEAIMTTDNIMYDIWNLSISNFDWTENNI